MTWDDRSVSKTAGAVASTDDGQDEMHATMVDFAESATAMVAASIRMQIVMLEQTRAMLGDFNHVLAEMTGSMKTSSWTDENGG